MNLSCHLSSPRLSLQVPDISPSSSFVMLFYNDSFISNKALRAFSPHLISEFFHSLFCVSCSEKKLDVHSGVAAGAHDISGGGDRHWLACRPMPGPNDAGWGFSGETSKGVGLWEIQFERTWLKEVEL